MRIYNADGLINQRAQFGEAWYEFLRVMDLSMGVYHLEAGATDLQQPHSEDEVYYVLRGKGQIHVAGEDEFVETGSLIYVAKHDTHYFHSIEEDLDILVFFAPAEDTNKGNKDVHRLSNGYTISTNPADLDFEVIHSYLSRESYWARGRSPSRMRKAIDNSLCFGVYLAGKQVGFARVITDFATRAYLSDVFIVREHRGRGLGKWLIERVLKDSRLEDVPSWILHTEDAHSLYERYGFSEPETPRDIMEMRHG